MATDVHKIYGQKGEDFFAYVASADSLWVSGEGFTIIIDSASANTKAPQTKEEVIGILKRITQYYEENDYPPA